MLVLRETDDYGNPGVVRGKMGSRSGLGGYPIPGVPTLWWLAILVDLEATTYVTGGVPFKDACFSHGSVHDLCVMGGPDPYSCGPANVPKGLTFRLDNEDPCESKLIICDGDTELADGANVPGESVWLRLGVL